MTVETNPPTPSWVPPVMKKSAILELKHAWSKIHPPLPRTPRESRVLLNALTSSFRRQLDHEYPDAQPSAADRASANTKNNDGKQQPSMKPDSAVQMTDKHFMNILENPLFRVVPHKQWPPGVTQEKVLKKPMVVFDELVASGLASQATIAKCLKCQNLLSIAAKENRVESMRASRAGSKFMSWWYSIDTRQRYNTLLWSDVNGYVANFLVAEGLQDTVMLWWRMALTPGPHGDKDCLLVRAPQGLYQLLFRFLLAEIDFGRGLEFALQYHIQACRLTSSAYGQTIENLPKQCKRALVRVTADLNRRIIMSGLTGTEGVSGRTYDEYMALNSSLAPTGFLPKAMPIYHPTSPDPWQFLAGLDRGTSLMASSKVNHGYREVLMRASFDALRVLIDKEEFDDATRLARTIQEWLNWKAASASKTDTPQPVSAEAEYLLGRLEQVAT